MKIKPVPIININTNNTIQSFDITRPKKKDPNEGKCPYCQADIKERYNYVYYTTPIEEYGVYTHGEFQYDDREQSGDSVFYCPECNHKLTEKQVDRMLP